MIPQIKPKLAMVVGVLFFAILLLPIINAVTEDSFLTYPAGDVELYITCKENQGKLCDANTNCNISQLIDPSGNIILENKNATRKYDGYYNYSLSLTVLGDYIQKSVCTNTTRMARSIKKIRIVDKLLTEKIDEINITLENITIENIAENVWSYNLGSNKSANETLTDIYDSTKGLENIGLLFGSFFASGLFIFFCMRQNNGQMPLKIVFFISSMLALLLGLNLTRAIAVDNGASSNVVKLINTSYVLIIWVFLISFVLFIIYMIAQYLHEKKLIEQREEEE